VPRRQRWRPAAPRAALSWNPTVSAKAVGPEDHRLTGGLRPRTPALKIARRRTLRLPQ